MRALFPIILVLSGLLQAQDEPGVKLRTRLEPAGPVLVGEPIRLQVDVLVTTWLTRAPVLPSLEIEGALVVLPDERASNLTETIEGQSWFGVSRSYLIYPQEARQYVVPPAEVIVNYGQATAPASLPLEPLTFRARIPSEARGLGYFIATTSLQLSQTFDRALDNLKVGESIQRTIRISAEKTFAMFLPPVEFEPMEGLSVYPDPPRIQDRSVDRLGFQGGERIESATYVIQEEGDYEFPPFQVYWWDLNTSRMREATIPAVQFSAEPNPDYVPEIPLPEITEEAVVPIQEETWLDWLQRWAVPLLVILVSIPFLIQFLNRMVLKVLEVMKDRRERYRQSEGAAFDLVKSAARKGETGSAIRYLYQWIDRILPEETVGTLARLVEGRRWDDQTERLMSGVYSKAPRGREWSGPAWITTLQRVRKEFKGKKRPGRRQEVRLPDLNP